MFWTIAQKYLERSIQIANSLFQLERILQKVSGVSGRFFEKWTLEHNWIGGKRDSNMKRFSGVPRSETHADLAMRAWPRRATDSAVRSSKNYGRRAGSGRFGLDPQGCLETRDLRSEHFSAHLEAAPRSLREDVKNEIEKSESEPRVWILPQVIYISRSFARQLLGRPHLNHVAPEDNKNTPPPRAHDGRAGTSPRCLRENQRTWTLPAVCEANRILAEFNVYSEQRSNDTNS